MRKSFVLELHGEWSEFADECIGLFTSFENHSRNRNNRDILRLRVCCADL
jgi:hypothetical protein